MFTLTPSAVQAVTVFFLISLLAVPATGEVLLGELTQLELQVSQHVAGAAITSNQSSAVDNTSALHHNRDIQIKKLLKSYLDCVI